MKGLPGESRVRNAGICVQCDLPHLSVRGRRQVCLVCEFFDYVKLKKTTLREAIDFLRDRSICAYCGDPADHVEHVIPRHTRLPTFTVPACHECNLMASGHLFGSFEDKATFIKRKIRKKYQKVMKTPEWDQEELQTMSKHMRAMIEGHQSLRKMIKARLDWSWFTVYMHASEEWG